MMAESNFFPAVSERVQTSPLGDTHTMRICEGREPSPGPRFLSPPDLDAVLAVLRSLRLSSVKYESDVVAAIRKGLDAAGVGYDHEVVLGPRCRIDLLTHSRIGIEVKKGKPNSTQVNQQIGRYAAFDAVAVVALVVERNCAGHLTESNGKPVHYVALNRNWGIAL